VRKGTWQIAPSANRQTETRLMWKIWGIFIPFYIEKLNMRCAFVRHSICAWQRPPTTRLTTFHVWKTGGCRCSFRLLMMDGVSPETCWASYKYGIIKFWYIVASCWIFLYELYCDARIHEHQIMSNVYFSAIASHSPRISKRADLLSTVKSYES
jgi:hypothetical protein